MDRRTFNTSLIGGAVAAALPLPVAASVATKPVASPLYPWAVAIARAQNRASPALLAQHLNISKLAASELYASMIANGVIKAPLFGGMARAAKPLFRNGQIVVADAKLGGTAKRGLKDIKRAFDNLAKVEEDAPDTPDAPQDQAT